jgi:HAMP domain-containing protein
LNNRVFHRLRLTTKLVIMMLTLLALSLTASIILSYLSQQELVRDMEDSINELSNATAVSVEQLSGEPNPAALQKLMARLGKKGVKEIKLLDVEKKEVIVSTLPQPGGAERTIESTPAQGGKREYTVTAPLVDGKDVLGYIHVTFTLDDMAQATKEILYERIAVTLLIFSLGIFVSLYLARKYTQPLHDVVRSAKQVAAGDLTRTIEMEGADEIAELTQSFNEMVEKLRQHRELEERLREAERLSAVGTLASGIAHEIRDPLNFMNLSIDHIRNRLGSGRPEEIAGLVTENGNVVGDITVDGTVGLLMFAGAFPGIAAGCLYVLIRRWLPGRRGWDGLLFGTLLLMIFGRAIINDDNADFTKLGPAAVNVTMFAMLFVLFGLLVAPLTGALDRRLPPVGPGMSRWFSRGYLVVLALLVLLLSLAGGRGGLPDVLPVIAAYMVIAAYVWWPALRARLGFLRSGWTVGVLRIAPYAVISIVAIVGAVFLALNLPKMV